MRAFKAWHLYAAFIALMLLRMGVGYHFFSEGADKLRTGSFDSGPFLASARGPLAPFYHQMVDDYEGYWRLCIKDTGDDGEKISPRIDTELTFAIWDDFVDRADAHYDFGDPLLLDVLRQRREASENPAERERLGEAMARLAEQREAAERILEAHRERLTEFFDVNRDEILKYANTASRLVGFQRDGPNRRQAARQTASLREQVETIRSDRISKRQPWLETVESIWDSLEYQINDLAVADQRELPQVDLHRPYAVKWSMQSIINVVIPWFDTIVGGLLLIGLFTRLASVLAGGFLISVVLSQPFWVPGTQETWLQCIELLAVFVLFATFAGRYGGLDFFIHRFNRKLSSHSSEAGEA